MPRVPRLPPTPQQSQNSYRTALLIVRWSRRTRERLLQERAAALGRDQLLRSAVAHLRRMRAQRLARWHKRTSAELHQWRSLMRLVVAAWRGWHSLLVTAAMQRATALQSRADRLCYWCFSAWEQYVRMRWRSRGGLIHYASALQQRCLRGWAAWHDERLAKRPLKLRLTRRGLLLTKRRAWRVWVASAERRGMALLERCAAERLSSEAELERSFAAWVSARLRWLRAFRQRRRAYLFISADPAHSWTRRRLQAHPRRPPRIH